MKATMRYDVSGTLHEEAATVDAVQAALAALDDSTRTSVAVEAEGAGARRTILSVHGHGSGALVCSWVEVVGGEPQFERWLLGMENAAEPIGVRVWGVDTRLPARFAVSVDAVRRRLQLVLEGGELGQHGPWEDAL